MKLETVQKAAFIECPNGVYYRVDYVDDDEQIVSFHNEDTGDEHQSPLNELDGWTAYKLTEVEE